MGKKAPKAPNPVKTVEAQSKYDQQTAQKNAELSHVDQNNPYGQLTWSVVGKNADGTPRYAQTQTFSAPIQQQFDLQNKNNLANLNTQTGLYDQISNNAKNPLSADSAGEINYGISSDRLNDYLAGMKTSAGPASTYRPTSYSAATYDPSTRNANTYNASTYDPSTYDAASYQTKGYQAQGYDPSTYQGQGYDPSTYQSQGYNANTYNAQGYDPSTYQAQGYNAAQADPAAQAAYERAAYGQIQNQAGVPQDQLNNVLQTQRDAYYKQQQSFLDPQWQEQQQQLAQQLANSGVVQNSEAYNKAMENFNRQREFSYNNARLSAIQNGGQEQSRLNNMALQNAQFANDAQAQGFGQAATNAQLFNQNSQFNAAAQNQINLANTGYRNQAAVYGADANNAASQYNTAARNQAAEYGANANNAAAQYNAGARNEADLYTANAANTANQYNTGALNQAAEYGANANNVANQYNATARNQAGEYGASANNAAAQFNSTLDAQTARDNFAAQNAARQYGADARNQAGQFNAASQNQAGQYNADALNQVDAFNAGARNDAGQYNASATTMARQNNANAANNAGQFNAGAINNMRQYNAGLNNEAINNMVNLELTNGQQNNAAQAQQMQQLFSLRDQPINELNALRQGASVSAPQFQSIATPQMAAPDYSGLVNANYQGNLGTYNNQMQALAQLGGNAAQLAMFAL